MLMLQLSLEIMTLLYTPQPLSASFDSFPNKQKKWKLR